MYHFISQTGKTRLEVMQQVVSDFDIKIDEKTQSPNEIPASTSNNSLVASLWAKHIHIDNNGIKSTLEDELYRFRSINAKLCEEDILQFWRTNETTFPKLAKIAKVLFGIPITSSKSEGAFSTAGCLIRKERAAITPYRIEKTLFVHDNYDLFKMK